MGEHAKGKVEVVDGRMLGFDFSVVNSAGDAELGNWLIASVRGRANADLIAEAFNVVMETGRTLRQLADDRAKLLEALRSIEMVAGNQSDENLMNPGGERDAAYRGILVCNARDVAHAAIAEAATI